MTRSFPRLAVACVLGLAAGTACQNDSVRPDLSPQSGVSAAPQKAGSPTPAVSAVEPSYGHQGETEDVAISGSGFVQGAAVIWARGDTIADPAIHVLATRFVSSTQLVATVSIDSNAEIALYDVIVTNPDRKKGIATESFEVTTAVVIGRFCSTGGDQSTAARGVNDAGQIVGNSCGNAFYWESAGPLLDLGKGIARRIDEAGVTAIGDGAGALVWTRGANAVWARTTLANGVRAFGLASDGNGVASLIGGSYQTSLTKRNTVERPALWLASSSGWQFSSLPTPPGIASSASVRVYDINAAGQAVGGGSPYPIVWEPSTSGYTATLLPGSGEARAISSDGNLIVGLYGLSTDSRAAYWVRSNGIWSGPIMLAPVCGLKSTYATQVNASGVVVGRSCDGAHAWRIQNGQIIASLRLPGLGKPSSQDDGSVWGLNNAQPARAVGMPGAQIAVYWDLPF